MILIVVLLALVVPVRVHAAAIGHTYVLQNTGQNITSTSYVDIPGASIASGNFTAGKKYLLYITAQYRETSTGFVWLRAAHGTTAFAESEVSMLTGSGNEYLAYAWFTVWTAVSGEAVKLQGQVSGTVPSADYARISMLAINLSDDLTENTDWFWSERTTDDALTTTPSNGGTVTFTPSGTSNWLVLTTAQIDYADISATITARLSRSGEASSATPETNIRAANASLLDVRTHARAFALTAASNTFTEVTVSSASSGTRLNSGLFALKLNKFRNHAIAYTDADAALSATDYATELQTVGLTPGVVSNVWILGYWGFDVGAVAREAEFRIQVDAADQPADQTTDNLQFSIIGSSSLDTAEAPMNISSFVSSMSASAHTIDLDASAEQTTGAPAGQHRQLAAVTMELAAPAANNFGLLRRRGQE